MCVCVCDRKSVCMSYTFWECVCENIMSTCACLHLSMIYAVCAQSQRSGNRFDVYNLIYTKVFPVHSAQSCFTACGESDLFGL